MSTNERRYHVVCIAERTGTETIMSRPNEPLTHPEACTMLSKFTIRKHSRYQLREV